MHACQWIILCNPIKHRADSQGSIRKMHLDASYFMQSNVKLREITMEFPRSSSDKKNITRFHNDYYYYSLLQRISSLTCLLFTS